MISIRFGTQHHITVSSRPDWAEFKHLWTPPLTSRDQHINCLRGNIEASQEVAENPEFLEPGEEPNARWTIRERANGGFQITVDTWGPREAAADDWVMECIDDWIRLGAQVGHRDDRRRK